MGEDIAKLTHVTQQGAVNMVDVSEKDVTHRSATATATISMGCHAIAAVKQNALKKGEALSTARIAGILGAKKVPELIPLCHSVPLSSVAIDFEITEESIKIVANALTDAKTGVEMEALTACSIAALTLYDMVKAIDKAMTISDIRLLHKSGGRSGDYVIKDK